MMIRYTADIRSRFTSSYFSKLNACRTYHVPALEIGLTARILCLCAIIRRLARIHCNLNGPQLARCVKYDESPKMTGFDWYHQMINSRPTQWAREGKWKRLTEFLLVHLCLHEVILEEWDAGRQLLGLRAKDDLIIVYYFNVNDAIYSKRTTKLSYISWKTRMNIWSFPNPPLPALQRICRDGLQTAHVPRALLASAECIGINQPVNCEQQRQNDNKSDEDLKFQ